MKRPFREEEKEMVMTMWLIIFALCCLSGIFLSNIPLGLVFIMSLFITLNGVISIFQRDKLTDLEIVILLIGIMSLAYTVCALFLGIDLNTIIGF